MTRSRVNADNSRSNTRSFAGTTEPSGFVDGSIWVDTDGVAASIQRLRWKKTPSAGTTVFTGNNDEGNLSLVYTPNYEEVFLNGVLLVRGVDYAATSGTSITFVEGTVDGDVVEVFCTPNLAVTDVYTTSQSEARYLPKSFLDAKGDLISASADNTPAKISVGSTGTVLAADPTATGGVSWQPLASRVAGGKNVLINGALDYNQRAVASVSSSGQYFADRWQSLSFSGTATWSRVALAPGSFANQTANFAIRVTSSSSSNDLAFRQGVEDATALSGQTVTFSCWARTSAGSLNVDLVEIYQNYGVGGSSDNYTYFDTTNKTYSTTWTKLTFTTTIPSAAGKTVGTGSFFIVRIDPAVVIPNGTYVEFTEFQLESSPVATAFSRAGGAKPDEERLCQRYYARVGGDTTYGLIGSGIVTNTTSAAFIVNLPVPMRVAPSSIDYSTLGVSDLISINSGVTSLGIVATESTKFSARLDAGVSSGGLTTNRPIFLRNFNSTSAYLGFNAEVI